MPAIKKIKKFLTRLLFLGRTTTTRIGQRACSLNSGGSVADVNSFTLMEPSSLVAAGSGVGQPSVVHALVVIFLEFFAWGLLTIPNINALNRAFPQHAFLMNGIIMGDKGFLSFLSAPLVGTLSDTWGRKVFLLLTVFFTCMPIPFMAIAPSDYYFVVVALSGLFGVTFSVIFAYVADVTDENERSSAYGLVSATFAASLVTSPALGAYMADLYGDNTVVALASAVALLDFLFILLVVPESLPRKLRITPTTPIASQPNSPGIVNNVAAAGGIDWEQLDPFQSLKKVGSDRTVMITSLTVFLSYLPEAGQYSCIFVYLRLVIGFSAEQVSIFLAVIGLLSVLSQTLILSLLMKKLGSRQTILVGLFFQALQLAWFGIGREVWMMYAAGILAALSSITYPAISAHVSNYASHDQQGLAQGVLTGVRGLCNGFGPALYGVIFYMFHVDLTDTLTSTSSSAGAAAAAATVKPFIKNPYHKFLNMGSRTSSKTLMPMSMNNSSNFSMLFSNTTSFINATNSSSFFVNNSTANVLSSMQPHEHLAAMPPSAIPGPAFVVGAMLVLLAMAAASFMPDVLDSLARGQEHYSALSRYSSVRGEFDVYDHDERGSIASFNNNKRNSNSGEKNEIIFYAAGGGNSMQKRNNTSKSKQKRRQQLHAPPAASRYYMQRAYKSVNDDRNVAKNAAAAAGTTTNRQQSQQPVRTSTGASDNNFAEDDQTYYYDYDESDDKFSSTGSTGSAATLTNTNNNNNRKDSGAAADGLSLNEEVFYIGDADNNDHNNADDDDYDEDDGDRISIDISHSSATSALLPSSSNNINSSSSSRRKQNPPNTRIQFTLGGGGGSSQHAAAAAHTSKM